MISNLCLNLSGLDTFSIFLTTVRTIGAGIGARRPLALSLVVSHGLNRGCRSDGGPIFDNFARTAAFSGRIDIMMMFEMTVIMMANR